MSGGILIFITGYIIWKKNSRTGANPNHKILCPSKRIIIYRMVGSFVSGVVSAMFGIGGGVIDEIVMILLLGMSTHLSAGTAMFGMSLTTVAAVIPHWFLGNIPPEYAIPLAIGCVWGGQIGPCISKRTQVSKLRKILGSIIIVVGLRMLLVPFTGG